MIETAEKPSQEKPLHIIDGNAMYHSLKEVPDTFGEIAKSIFKMIPHEKNVIFSTDMYLSGSIKSQERDRRGISERYLVKGPYVRRPASWKDFLSNDENKQTLTKMLLQTWSQDSFSEYLGDRKVMYQYSY